MRTPFHRGCNLHPSIWAPTALHREALYLQALAFAEGGLLPPSPGQCNNKGIASCWFVVFSAHGRSFTHEHPAGASSWKEDSTQAVLNLPGIYNALFDQCQFGLTSPRGTPLKKKTRILCNSARLFCALNGCTCRRGSHVHKPIMGSENGYRLSTWSENYPPALCNALLEACCNNS